MKYSAHLDLLLQELPLDKRIEAFSSLGFEGVEFWCWWDEQNDLDEIAKAAAKYEIEVAGLCTKFIPLTDGSQRADYMRALEETLKVCRKLNCKTIISQVGDDLDRASRQDQKDSIIKGLKQASEILESSGVTLVIEPLNVLVDHKGYFLSSSQEAFQIVKTVDADNVKILFDIYHQQITEGNVTRNALACLPRIGHMHLADNPGRHEPGTGEINYTNLLRELENAGYNEFIGLEYIPLDDSSEKLSQLKEQILV